MHQGVNDYAKVKDVILKVCGGGGVYKREEVYIGEKD